MSFEYGKGALPDLRDAIQAFGPVDLQTTANNGAWIDMADFPAVDCLFLSAIGTAGDDPVLSLEQATAAAGTGAKTLSIYRVDYKVGGTGFTAANDLWTRVPTIDRDNPVTTYDTDGINGAENFCMVNIHVQHRDLDVANGFRYIRLVCADVGSNAQLGVGLYLPVARYYQGKIQSSARA